MTAPIVALQMDPVSSLKIETDTTFALALEAQNRGYKLFAYTPTALSYAHGKILARGHMVTFKNDSKDYYKLGEETLLNLGEARYVLMRQDPPFDMAYIAATHFLELLPATTQVINNPISVRNAPEKLLVTYFKELTPPTLMSWDRALIEDFMDTHGSVVIKPLFEFGGNGILLLHQGDPNLTALLETYRKLYSEPPIFQKFLPEVAQGDKRIILIDGNPMGGYKRIPSQGQTRSNMRVGGRAEPGELTPKDREICAAIGPTLKERGLYLVGIDVIGDYLTEINVTSPTGIPVMNRLYNLDLAKDFWEGLA
ncbi:MAG: glutathione synthase [Alphaproteobacteria bacterium]|jgi:glutathione synthase|nr:glutathione synthase [Alphaproteobacteria bacterium]